MKGQSSIKIVGLSDIREALIAVSGTERPGVFQALPAYDIRKIIQAYPGLSVTQAALRWLGSQTDARLAGWGLPPDRITHIRQQSG